VIEFVTWLGGIFAKEIVKADSHAAVDKLRASELDRAIDKELKAWEKTVATHYAPGIQAGVLAHIFRERQPTVDIPLSYVALRSYLEQLNVPPSEVWLDVLITNWQHVKDTPGPLQPFFEDDLDTIKPFLDNLAHRLFQVCKLNEALFKGTVHDSLDLLHQKHDHLHQIQNEILRIVSDWQKEVDLAPVRSKNSCGAGIVLEQTSEPPATRNDAAALFGLIASLREQQFITFPLMVSFAVIMSAEFGQSPRQRALAEQDQLRKAFLLDRSNPPLRKSVQIRASGRKRKCFHAATRQHRPK
jgi:hypothetical protein